MGILNFFFLSEITHVFKVGDTDPRDPLFLRHVLFLDIDRFSKNIMIREVSISFQSYRTDPRPVMTIS